MSNHRNPHTPLVIVSNFAEAHLDFLERAADPTARAAFVDSEAYHGDRTLLWAGDDKLVVVSYPIAHASELYARCGYRRTRYVAPEFPTPYLSLDIIHDARLAAELVAYAGPARTLQIVPYATTPEFYRLAEYLRQTCSLTVILPESPHPENLWVRDYIDTKAGFHLLATRWLLDAGLRLPDAYVCEGLAQASAVCHWFNLRGRACIAKANTGESGIGIHIITPEQFASPQVIFEHLRSDPFFGTEPVIVEQFVTASQPTSPSVEVFVPPLGQGQPEITYMSTQLFAGFGDFCGVLVSRELKTMAWYVPLADAGLRMAVRLQAMGYAGHFDIDAVVDDAQRVYLLELNARRTGGTHVHEFACHFFGPDYLDKVTLLSREAVDSGDMTSFAELAVALDGLLFPIAEAPRGVIITITSSLVAHRFGTLIVGADVEDTLSLLNQMMQRL